MKNPQNVIFFSILLLYLVKCAPPPTPQPLEQILPDNPKLVGKDKRHNLSFKRLENSDPTLVIENSTVTINLYDNYQTIEHQLIIVPHNLQNGAYYPGWSFSTGSDGITLDNINNTCKIIEEDNGIISQKNCKASQTIDNEKIKFSYTGNINNKGRLIVNYKYNKTTEEILFKTKTIIIPLIKGSSFCDYKYIIQDGVINLGLENNLLTKESRTLYSYLGQCPNESLSDVIRYSPESVLWNADMKLNLEYSPKFTNNVNFIFPRYYKGGKHKEKFYKINSTENEEYNEKDIIYEDTKYRITIPAANKEKIGVELNTNFTNNLSNDFKDYLPENYYSIDLSKIDQEIQDKAKEIISETSDFPNYYKLGQYIYSNMTYDISYTGKNLTLKEIYKGKIGVCEHYTLLYNAMLNSIGIKTLFISGWAFSGNQTSANGNTTGHAWTGALIDGKWKELDSTWGLFEGISAGHIYKNFGEDTFSYSFMEENKNLLKFDKSHNINMISIINGTDYSESNDDDSETDKTTEQAKTEEETQSITESKKESDNKDETDNTEEIKISDKSNENESDKNEEVIVQSTINNEEKTDKKEDDEEEEEDIGKIIFDGRNDQNYIKLTLSLFALLCFILC